MPAPRAFCAALATNGRLYLSPEESHHLVKVRRMALGSAVDVLDGRGHIWHARLEQASAREAVLVVEQTRLLPPPACPVRLAQVVPVGGTMESLVARCVELGVASIQPLISTHCELRVDAARAADKVAKWRAIVLEAVKQSGHPFAPDILPLQPLTPWLQQLPSVGGGGRLVAALTPEARPLRHVMGEWVEPRPPAGAWLLIGPEGDLSPEEYRAASAAGFQAITLGPRVLRVETAALAALTLLQDAVGGLLPTGEGMV